jgi:hypothetical protein
LKFDASQRHGVTIRERGRLLWTDDMIQHNQHYDRDAKYQMVVQQIE